MHVCFTYQTMIPSRSCFTDSSANLLISAGEDIPPQPTKTALEFTFTYNCIQKFEKIHI